MIAPFIPCEVDDNKRDHYVGEVQDNKRHGKGTYSYKNRFFVYDGEWVDGQKHGTGSLKMMDGSFYEGEFEFGEMTGYGEKYSAIFKTFYKGDFLLGEMHGEGVMTYPDGGEYTGSWESNKRSGQGRLIEKDGTTYVGEFYNDKKHGEGELILSDGSSFVGNFVNNKKQGHGVMKFANQECYDGQWRNDVPNGQGEYSCCASQVQYRGMWLNGKPDPCTSVLRVDTNATAILAGQSVSMQISLVSALGQNVILETGREIEVRCYINCQDTAETNNESLLEAIEDSIYKVETLPDGTKVVEYPINPRDESSVELAHEEISIDTSDLSCLVQEDIRGETCFFRKFMPEGGSIRTFVEFALPPPGLKLPPDTPRGGVEIMPRPGVYYIKVSDVTSPLPFFSDKLEDVLIQVTMSLPSETSDTEKSGLTASRTMLNAKNKQAARLKKE